MKIGIPRALIYWKRPYFWESFFENLGFEVLLSPKTNKEIVEMGVKVADPETCFSNKVYWGHLLWLEGKTDYIFVPRLKANQEKLEYCPKFFGLPDLAKILVNPVRSSQEISFNINSSAIRKKYGVSNGVKTPILTETFDERKEKFEKTLEKLGKKLKKNKEEIRKAAEIASLKEKELKTTEEQEFFKKIQSEKQKIILVSHPYNLFDDYVNLRMKEELEKLGAEPIFIDEVPTPLSSVISHRASKGGEGRKESKVLFEHQSSVKFHWEFGEEIMGKIQEILKYKIDGAIEISSFACGCDAVIKEFVEKSFKEANIPFLYLIIDEHTGEAGIQTRLEAFMDTI
jgi:predicted nucleotide-binding protein (sugar kinase/HSP70/actin superfamily)